MDNCAWDDNYRPEVNVKNAGLLTDEEKEIWSGLKETIALEKCYENDK